MPQLLIDDKFLLVQVMSGAWRHQAITWTSDNLHHAIWRHQGPMSLAKIT